MTDITHSSHNLFHTFLVRPDIQFETQQAGETVVLVVRKHPLTQLYWIINALLLLFIGFLLSIFLFPQLMDAKHIFVFQLFLIFFTFSYVWLNFLLWYFTVGIVTSERILDLDFFNVLYKEFSATTIDHVSDITTKIGGFFRTFFNFGTVFIKTQGFEQNIEFIDVSQPAEVVEIINNLMSTNNP